MRNFFIDLENVRSYGLEGVLLLRPDDMVYVFYSDNANTLTIPTIESLNDSPATVKYIKTNYIGANAMDFQIVTLLGATIERDKQGSFYIISHDNGFKSAVKFCEGYFQNYDIVTGVFANIILALNSENSTMRASSKNVKTSNNRFEKQTKKDSKDTQNIKSDGNKASDLGENVSKKNEKALNDTDEKLLDDSIEKNLKKDSIENNVKSDVGDASVRKYGDRKKHHRKKNANSKNADFSDNDKMDNSFENTQVNEAVQSENRSVEISVNTDGTGAEASEENKAEISGKHKKQRKKKNHAHKPENVSDESIDKAGDKKTLSPSNTAASAIKAEKESDSSENASSATASATEGTADTSMPAKGYSSEKSGWQKNKKHGRSFKGENGKDTDNLNSDERKKTVDKTAEKKSSGDNAADKKKAAGNTAEKNKRVHGYIYDILSDCLSENTIALYASTLDEGISISKTKDDLHAYLRSKYENGEAEALYKIVSFDFDDLKKKSVNGRM